MSIRAVPDNVKCDDVLYRGIILDKPFCVRWARHEDYDEVMKIDENIHDGADYLPTSYHGLIDDPTEHSFVAELDGEVIGYLCSHIDGLTNTITVGHCGRQKAKYRHRGLFLHFKVLTEIEMKKIYPSLKFNWAFCALNDGIAKHINDVSGRIINQKIHIHGETSPENIKSGPELGNMHINAYMPSLSELTDLLSNPKVLHYLYPNGAFIHADKYIPFPTSEYYVRNVLEKGLVVISGKIESNDFALSTLYVHPCPFGVRLAISYDGIPDSNIIKAHILKASEYTAALWLPKLNNQQIKNPKIRISILSPCIENPDSIWEFLKETFNCENNEEATLKYVFFEMPYK